MSRRGIRLFIRKTKNYLKQIPDFFVQLPKGIAGVEHRITEIRSQISQVRTDAAKTGLVLYSIINFNVWLSIIHDLFEMDEALTPFQKRWNKISERIRQIKDTRDQLAHHSVHQLKTDASAAPPMVRPSQYDTRRKSKRQQPVDAQDANDFTTKVLGITEDLMALSEAMFDALESASPKTPA